MRSVIKTVLGNQISAEDFLREYWQQKPLVIRGAFSSELNLISAEELAGYSLEEDIESRLILSDNSSKPQWQLMHGPFEEEDYQQLQESHWTLLVQSLDYFHSQLHDLIRACSFLPRWRLDDIMVSYATDQGGVGPHLDKYDVFLVQGAGQRRWRVGHKNQQTSPQPNDAGISQIHEFDADIDVTLNCGDVLYVPPNTPHWGISIGESINYSIGFRAPSAQAILQTALELQETEQSFTETLWQDAGLLQLSHAKGQLDSSVEPWLLEQAQRFCEPMQLKRAMAKLGSEPKYPLPDDDLIPSVSLCEAQELSEVALLNGVKLHPLARITYIQLGDADIDVFIHGENQQFPSEITTIIDDLNSEHYYPATMGSNKKHSACSVDNALLREFYCFALLQGAIALAE